ncbi:hypothetical protein NP233_g5452 [Leucocoprinus birnbaumii]|uniref:Uncharacterized protein n=1 Tax=Leucocoprinus birnbaumii TaxID=56174 RepID=A0AAD5YWF9_9AGAR|nr:hypothetical protein NP233_g5452 [Leucocoprinus birnbaumii]
MAPNTNPAEALPKDYTFMNTEIFISLKAKEMVDDLLEKAANRNPDAFDLYIYNDYYPYAIHNLIESFMSTIKTKVTRKDWKEAFYAIEALTFFFEIESVWATCDDGELTDATNKVYGALLLEILKGLQGSNALSPKNFPNLENVLQAAYNFGESIKELGNCKSVYTAACKAIANSLFKNTTSANQKLHEARLREYAESIEDAERRIHVLEDVEEYVKEVKKTKSVWYNKGNIGKSEIKNTGLTRAWSDYKGRAPAAPFRGPPEWDLSKWTEEDKSEFSYDNMDDDIDEFM